MFEIIILFVIASILSNIVKALGRSASPQRNTAPREMPSKVNETWAPEKDIKGQAPKYKIKAEETTSDIEKALHVTSQAKLKTTPQAKSQVRPQVAPKVSTRPNKLQPDSRRELTNFTPNRLVEGIILSEILAPPKCQRQKIR